MNSQRKKAYLALLINTLIWGAAFPVVKTALFHTTPFRWLFYRYLIAVIISTPILLAYLYRYKPTLKTILNIIATEMLGTTIVLGLLYEGLRTTSALDASLISATAPLFVIAAGIFWLREREDKKEWIGFTIAFIGTLIIIFEPLIALGKVANGSSIVGNLLILSRNMLWALYLVIAKKLYKNISKPMITMISFWVAAVSFGILSFILTPSFLFADLVHPSVLYSALYMAIPGSLIAATLYLYGQNLIEISEATLFSYLEPIVSIPLAMLLLGDHLYPSTVIGMVVIAIGVYLAEYRVRRV